MDTQRNPSKSIVRALKDAKIDLVASLPDQWLIGLIAECEADPGIQNIRLSREDDGVGLCFGAHLGGRRAALICQNAGVLLSANVLGALAHHHQVPLLILASYRGGIDDNHYYQMYKGRVTEGVLKGLGIPFHILEDQDDLGKIGDAAQQCMLNRMPTVLLLHKRALLNITGE